MAINLCKYYLMFLCLMNNVLGACCCSDEKKTTEVKLKPEDGKPYIAKALGINEKDIWYFEKIVNKSVNINDLKTRSNNGPLFAQSCIVILKMSIVKNDGIDIDWNNCISFVALIKNDIKFDIQAKLLKSIPSIGKFLSDNRGKTVKYISIHGHVVYHIRHYEVL